MNLGRAIVYEEMILSQEDCRLDGRYLPVSLGNWAFYIAGVELKALHAVDGKQHCIHSSAPLRSDVFSGRPFKVKASYQPSDWVDALSKPVLLRAAENIVVARRLAAAGIGPALLGVCGVRRFSAWYAPGETMTAGYFVENLLRRTPKPPTTAADLARAGVAPDRINSCLREQIAGYVSDLNSVVGVMPIDADDEVAEVAGVLEGLLA